MDGFRDRVRDVARVFSENKDDHVHIFAHFDSDGISACAILVKAFLRAGVNYSVTVVQNLTGQILKEVETEDHKVYFFADLGSGSISGLEKLSKKIFILDHHMVEKEPHGKNIYHLNPHSFGIDGSNEISGAGVAFLFARELDAKNDDLAHLAIIGAIGDFQEEFGSLNREILGKAIDKGTLKAVRELKIFGRETKPLYKVLEHSIDPEIPGATGSPDGSIRFLEKAGIQAKKGKIWKFMADLSSTERARLEKEVIRARKSHGLTDDPFGTSYILPMEDKGTPFRDAREFSTLLNACGRLGKSSLGIGACLGDTRMKEKSVLTLRKYKNKMTSAMNWLQKNDNSLIRSRGYVVINAKDEVPASLIGTMSSIISMSGNYKEGTFILSMARILESGLTKASMRVSGRPESSGLSSIIARIVEKVGGESGGHDNAAGALFDTSLEKKFIDSAVTILERESIEEKMD